MDSDMPQNDGRTRRIVKGLENLGNTCYFNSIMQNLLALDGLRDHFMKPAQYTEGPITSALRNLYAETSLEGSAQVELSNIRTEVLIPDVLLSAIREKSPQFKGCMQQDSHEFLRCLIENLHTEEESLRVSNSSARSFSGEAAEGRHIDASSNQRNDETLVDHLFRGQLCSIIHCSKCGYRSVKYEPFHDLSLPIPSKGEPLNVTPPIPSKEEPLNVTPPGGINSNSDLQCLGGAESPLSSKEVDHVASEEIEGTQVSEELNTDDTLDEQPAASVSSNMRSGNNDDILNGHFSNDESSSIPGSHERTAVSRTHGRSDDESSSIPGSHERTAVSRTHGRSDDESSSIPGSHERTAVSRTHERSATSESASESDERSSSHERTAVLRTHERSAASESASESDERSSSNERTAVSRTHERSAASESASESATESDERSSASEPREEDENSPVPEEDENSPVPEEDENTMDSKLDDDLLNDLCSYDESSAYAIPENTTEVGESETLGATDISNLLEGTLISNETREEEKEDALIPISIDDCLEEFTRAEILDGWNCEKCQSQLFNGSGNLENSTTMEEGDRISANLGEMDLEAQKLRSTAEGHGLKKRKAWMIEDEVNSCEPIIQEATKRYLISKAPPILTIHLKRFQQNLFTGRFIKLNRHVSFEEMLDLSPHLDSSSSKKDSYIYRLIGVVEHAGVMGQGHYFAYVRCDQDDSVCKWFLVSDSLVKEVSWSIVLQSRAYLLFYEKCKL